jgi:hypothetical protein
MLMVMIQGPQQTLSSSKFSSTIIIKIFANQFGKGTIRCKIEETGLGPVLVGRKGNETKE